MFNLIFQQWRLRRWASWTIWSVYWICLSEKLKFGVLDCKNQICYLLIRLNMCQERNSSTNTELIFFCIIISELMGELGIYYNKDLWRLFINGSEISFETVLLPYGSQYPSIPIIYSGILKKTCNSPYT